MRENAAVLSTGSIRTPRAVVLSLASQRANRQFLNPFHYSVAECPVCFIIPRLFSHLQDYFGGTRCFISPPADTHVGKCGQGTKHSNQIIIALQHISNVKKKKLLGTGTEYGVLEDLGGKKRPNKGLCQ